MCRLGSLPSHYPLGDQYRAGEYTTATPETATSLYRQAKGRHILCTDTVLLFQLGPRCMTIGLTACILRDVPFSAIYFPSYAHLKVTSLKHMIETTKNV